LGKVRIHADSGAECEQAAAELAQRVPCEVVSRVGRVVLLHRPA
jgi:RNA-binding protein YhbY